ncbi:hypothetical protein [Devosia sp. DBB001]|nr:hypothetical protein [Devosia sp. DBB001]
MSYAWFDAGNGRRVYRRVTAEVPKARSSLACPQVIRAFAQPVQSMADGQWYDNPRDLSRSHRANGNPHGIDFIELGNEEMPFVEHKTDERQLRDDIREAMQDVKEGRLPEVLHLQD